MQALVPSLGNFYPVFMANSHISVEAPTPVPVNEKLITVTISIAHLSGAVGCKELVKLFS